MMLVRKKIRYSRERGGYEIKIVYRMQDCEMILYLLDCFGIDFLVFVC